MNNPIEKMARIICEKSYAEAEDNVGRKWYSNKYEKLNLESSWTNYLHTVDDCLDALRDPTENMMKAAMHARDRYRASSNNHEGGEIAEIWKAMLSALKTETPDSILDGMRCFVVEPAMLS